MSPPQVVASCPRFPHQYGERPSVALTRDRGNLTGVPCPEGLGGSSHDGEGIEPG